MDIWIRVARLLVVAVALSTAGCATFSATDQQLRKRAAFDLGCPESALEVIELDDRTRGVRGCDHRATYISQCKPCANGYVGCECTWVMNTEGGTHEASPDKAGGG